MLIASLVGTGIRAAQDAAPAAITIVNNAEGHTVPAELPAGVVTVTFDNQAEAPFVPGVAWLNEGATPQQLGQAMQESPDAALGFLTLNGGAEVAPMTSKTMTFDLDAGSYYVINFAAEDMSTLPPSFTVTQGTDTGAAEPESDVTFSLLASRSASRSN